MIYEEYLKVIKNHPVTESLCLIPVSVDSGPRLGRLPLTVFKLTDKTSKFIRIPATGINPYGHQEVPVVSIYSAFIGNENVTDIVLTSNIREISRRAFSGCRKLARITIPKNVRVIEKDTFKDCDSLTDVYYEGSKEEWDRIVIEDSERVTEFGDVIPGTSVREIKSDRLVHLTGNDPLRMATIHFNCGLEFDGSLLFVM